MLRSCKGAALPLRFLLLMIAAVLAVAAMPAPAGARPFGSTPLDDVIAAADAKKRTDCNLPRDYLAALALTVTFPETGANGSIPPSPMTLSRYDTHAGLYAFNSPTTTYQRAFFHPGIGVWQADSGGLGRPHSADYWMNTATAAPVVTAEIARLWCQAWADPATYPTDVERRARAWSPWNACRNTTTCETIFAEIYNGTALVNMTRFSNVTRTGGLQARSCRIASGATVTCWYADPARAEGYSAWASPTFGPSPITAPFYVYESGGVEHRHWVTEDSGYADDIHAARPLTASPRGGISRELGGSMCDIGSGRGACGANEALGPPREPVATDPDTVGSGLGIGAHATGSTTFIAERRSDGSTRVVTPTGGSGASVAYLGGITPSDPDITSVVDGGREVVVRGTDNAVWTTRTTATGWASWRGLGGIVSSAPTTGSRSSGTTDVFVRGADHALWTGRATASGFSGWSPLGGLLESDPEVAVSSNGQMMVFVVGADRAIWYRLWDGGAWQGWAPLGGALTSSPGAVSASGGTFDVAARGIDGALWTRSFNGSTWSAWSSLGGVITAAPDYVALGSGNVRVYGRGIDGRLWLRTRTSGSWSAWTPAPW